MEMGGRPRRKVWSVSSRPVVLCGELCPSGALGAGSRARQGARCLWGKGLSPLCPSVLRQKAPGSVPGTLTRSVARAQIAALWRGRGLKPSTTASCTLGRAPAAPHLLCCVLLLFAVRAAPAALAVCTADWVFWGGSSSASSYRSPFGPLAGYCSVKGEGVPSARWGQQLPGK